MPVTFENEEYLNVKEACEYVTEGSFYVFNKLRAKIKLQPHRCEGKGRSIYYRRRDLDELRLMMGIYPAEIGQ